MLPPAPGRLSTSTGCFQASPSFWPSARATVSTAPPAANGTTIRTGLEGNDWAKARAENAAASRTAGSRMRDSPWNIHEIIGAFSPRRKGHDRHLWPCLATYFIARARPRCDTGAFVHIHEGARHAPCAGAGARGEEMGGQDRQSGGAIPDGVALFDSLFGQNFVGVAVGSPEGRFLRVNDALCRMLGYEGEELLDRSFQEITHPDDQQASRDFLQELMTTSQSRVYEKRYLCKDGSILWVRITGTFIRDASGAPLCSVALVYDITRQRAAEDALRASENRFRRMVEMSSDWYWV